MGETVSDDSIVEQDGTSEATTENTDNASVETEESDDTSKSSSTDENGEEKPVVVEDEEPPVRKPRTNADWVALRRAQKLERAKHAPVEDKGGEADDDDDISPEDASIIDRRLAKALEPIMQDREKEQLTSEVTSFVAENPDFKPYVEKVKKWAQNPSWENVPIDKIFFAVAGKDLLYIGAQRKAEADKKARETRTGGSSTATVTGSKPVQEMTDAEFASYSEKVRMGKK